jgi:hypothetical protein
MYRISAAWAASTSATVRQAAIRSRHGSTTVGSTILRMSASAV